MFSLILITKIQNTGAHTFKNIGNSCNFCMTCFALHLPNVNVNVRLVLLIYQVKNLDFFC